MWLEQRVGCKNDDRWLGPLGAKDWWIAKGSTDQQQGSNIVGWGSPEMRIITRDCSFVNRHLLVLRTLGK